jgi:hypothetical protein
MPPFVTFIGHDFVWCLEYGVVERFFLDLFIGNLGLKKLGQHDILTVNLSVQPPVIFIGHYPTWHMML